MSLKYFQQTGMTAYLLAMPAFSFIACKKVYLANKRDRCVYHELNAVGKGRKYLNTTYYRNKLISNEGNVTKFINLNILHKLSIIKKKSGHYKL